MTGDCENARLSLKRKRIYCRTFNYAECRDLLAQGWTQKALAEKYEVSTTTIRRATDPEFRRAFDARKSAYIMGGVCSDCGKEGVSRYGSGRCKDCADARARTSLRFDSAGTLAEIRCGTCKTWLLPEAFPPKKRAVNLKGSGNRTCSACGTKARKEYRDRHKVPCAACGTPVLATSEKSGHGYDVSGLCPPCWHEQRRRAA